MELNQITFLLAASAVGFALVIYAFVKLAGVKAILQRELSARERLQDELRAVLAQHAADAAALRAIEQAAPSDRAFEAGNDDDFDDDDDDDMPTVQVSAEAAAFMALNQRHQQTKNELYRLRIRLEKQSLESHRAKDSFLAHMSHEMRTPLNIILGYSDLLADRASCDGLDDMLPDIDKIRLAGTELLEKINHVLELSKIRAGRVATHYDLFDLADLVEELAQTFAPTFEERGNQFVIEVPEGTERMEIDLGKLHRVLERLLINANRFTKAGTIALEVTTEDVHGLPWIHFTVRDNGCGIDRKKLDLLFKGVLSSKTTILSEREEGGLGLALCQSLAVLLGGHLTVESTVDVGTNAVLSVPALRADGTPTVGSDTTYEVLVVCGDEERRRALMEESPTPMLDRKAVAPREITEQILRKSSATLVLIDVMMELSVASPVFLQLREQAERKGFHVMLISMFDFIGESLAVGVLGYLVKPVAEARLHQILSALFQETAEPQILVVSADSDLLQNLNDVLVAQQRRTEAVQRGSDALRYLAEHQPHLLIVDLALSDMDGYSLLEKIHQNGFAQAPVIFLSAGLPGSETALEAGSRISHFTYFEEPFSTDFKKHLQKQMLLAIDQNQ